MASFSFAVILEDCEAEEADGKMTHGCEAMEMNNEDAYPASGQ